MSDADDIVIEALLDDVLDPSMMRDAVDEALEILQRDDSPDRLARLDADLADAEPGARPARRGDRHRRRPAAPC